MVEDRNLDVAANEKSGAVDNAQVGRQLHALVEFIFRHKSWPWSIKAEAERELVVLQAARFAFPAHAENEGIYRAKPSCCFDNFAELEGSLPALPGT
jgi:hypothetical protein